MSGARAPSVIADMQPTPAAKRLPKKVKYASRPPQSSSGRVVSDCAVAAPSASRRALRCPPTYPQDPKHSVIDVGPNLKSIAEWQTEPPVNQDNKLAKIVYAMSANTDQEMAYHYIPEDVVGLTGWHPFVHASRYRRRALSMEWEGAESHAHTATTDGEYCLVEAHAVPFYLQHIFADRYGLFEVVTVPLRLLEILLEHLEEFMQQQATAGPDDSTSFRNFMQQAHNKKIPRMRFELRYAAEKEYKAVVTLLTHLEESEVCVVPSVLLLNKEHTANEWYAMLRLLETGTPFDLEVFPRIDVEQKMENKDLYFTALMRSPRRYIPLDVRQDSALAPASSSASSQPAGKEQMWRGCVPFVHCRSNGITCPTIVIPNWDALVEYQNQNASQSSDEHIKRFVRDMIELLQEEVSDDGWQVDPGEWVFKGLNSTRSNVMRQMTDIDAMAVCMNEAAEQGMKLCAPQPGFLLQPFMHGLRWESRTYFNRGEYQFSLMSDQPPSHRAGRASAFNTVEVRGHTRISQSEFGYAQAQMVDFCVHILKECEHHCKLVSQSGILRVDLGAEFLYCSGGQTEAQLRNEQRNPMLWHLTGAEFIVRFFLNEVTSSLDINWFSQQTNYPIVYEAAYVTSQLLLELIAARPSVKCKRTEHGIYLLDPRRPEPPLSEGEVKRNDAHVCQFQCEKQIQDVRRQLRFDKKRSRRERRKPKHQQDRALLRENDARSPKKTAADKDDDVVEILPHRPIHFHPQAPPQPATRLRTRRQRIADDSDDDDDDDDDEECKEQPRTLDSMRDDDTNANGGTEDQDADSIASGNDPSGRSGEEDEVQELPPPTSVAPRSASQFLNGLRNSISRRPPVSPLHRHAQLPASSSLPPHDAGGVCCFSSDSDESDDLSIGDEVDDQERKRRRQEHQATKNTRQRESNDEIEADGDQCM